MNIAEYSVTKKVTIWLTVPLAIIGITAGLLVMDVAFGFMGLLGALSLVGLLIKNAIVLIEEIDMQIADGKESYTAILDSSVSRMRPVMMAAKHHDTGHGAIVERCILSGYGRGDHVWFRLCLGTDAYRGAGALCHLL